MEKLNQKQKLFCDYYIQSNNIKESALKAGYSITTALKGQIMGKPAVKAYLKELVEKRDAKLVMQTDEILQILTRIGRGEEMEEVLMSVGVGDGRTEVQRWNRQAIPKDRLKALELLGKYLGMWDKMKDEISTGNHNITITFEEKKQIESKS
jgi:phage terminase small subunit